MSNVIRLERSGRTRHDAAQPRTGGQGDVRAEAGPGAVIEGPVARSGFAMGGGASLVRLRVSAVPAGAERAPAAAPSQRQVTRSGGGGVVALRGGSSQAKGACGRAPARPSGLGDAERVDAAWVVARLEEAGRTLLALPGTGYSTRLRTSSLDIVRTAMEAYGGEVGRARPPVPSAAHITRMDEALGWIPLIPQDQYVLRRIVGARCLVSPVTGRALYSWRRLGGLLGADHKAVQRWHAQGIAMLVTLLGG